MEKEKLKENFYKGTITDETLTKANAILVIKCANLEQQCKKQKEVIDKTIEYINNHSRDENGDIGINLFADEVFDLLEILKEVSE